MALRYFCHYCQVHIRIPSYLTLPTCPYCQTQFVEEETPHLGTTSGQSVESLPPMDSQEYGDEDDGQDEWYDPWYLEFLPARGYFDQQQQDSQEETNSDHDQTQEQLWRQDEEDVIPWFPAEDGNQDNDSVSSWVTNRSSEHDNDNDNDDDDENDNNKSGPDSNSSDNNSETPEEQQWITDEDDSGDESAAYQLFLSINNHSHNSPAPSSNGSHSSSPSSSSSSSSSLLLSSSASSHNLHPSIASSYSSPPSGADQQQSSTTSHPSSSNHRQNGLFRIERLLDMIYQGYSESDNEMDDTHYTYHQGFMDNLMDIFSDPMETPQTSTNSGIEQCIERLSKRTLLHDDIGTLQECTICQEPFGASIEIIQMPCQHEYHNPCLSQWLYVNATCPICRCPASSIIERTPPPPLLPLVSLPSPTMQRSSRQRRYSYPVIPEDYNSMEEVDEDGNQNVQEEQEQDDGDDDQLSEYYEVTDPPPIWARSSSSSATATTTLQSSPSSSSRSHLVYHHLHDC